MFKKSENIQGNLFSSISTHISSRKQKLLNAPNSWQNIFYKEIICRLDEQVYSVLFCQDNGRPNASMRVLVGMMILKEGNGWSDEQLFEECRFNIKVMMALGYMNLDEDIPTESTYYSFRKLLAVYNSEHGEDLVKKSFHQITKEQVKSYNVSGRKIRLDSKLINSNIAISTRIDLVLETVRKFIGSLDLSKIKRELGKKRYKMLVELQTKSTTNLTYSLSKEEKASLLKKFGHVINTLLAKYKGEANYEYLERLYNDQYKVKNKQEDKNDEHGGDGEQGSGPVLKQGKELDSSNLQSIHDPDAAYRVKGHGHSKQQVNGYHANITETCDEENELNLIVDVQLDKANISEAEFLLNSIESTEQLLQSANSLEQSGELSEAEKIIQRVISDGGYDSKDNRKEMSHPDKPDWTMGKNKGKQQRFKMNYDEQNNLQVIDKKSGQKCEVNRSKKRDKIVIKFLNGKTGKQQYYCYTEEEIKDYISIQNILSRNTKADRNLRANVEATIHQVFHRLLKRNKIKYRGQYKCNMYVLSRVLWTNFRRICKNEVQKADFLVLFFVSAIVYPQTDKFLIKGQS